jgi:two-component system KDP operon response regulator KdpE
MTANLARILAVDDEPQIIRFLRPALSAAGYEVIIATTAAEALRSVVAEAPDVVLLDLGLPDRDGKEVIRQIRAWSRTPIIVLSARDREAEKIEALDAGADDYVNKPFVIGELLARLRVALRHAQDHTPVATEFTVGDTHIDVAKHSVAKAGQAVYLTPKEFDLLVFLARHVGRVVTHRQILGAVWGPAHVEDVQYLRVLIGQLRHKIETQPAEPALLVTEPGIGYRLVSNN